MPVSARTPSLRAERPLGDSEPTRKQKVAVQVFLQFSSFCAAVESIHFGAHFNSLLRMLITKPNPDLYVKWSLIMSLIESIPSFRRLLIGELVSEYECFCCHSFSIFTYR